MKISKSLVSIVLLALALLSPQKVIASIYYVDPSGDNSNPGTELLPWKTIKNAAQNMIAGDTVYVKNGTYTDEIFAYASGTPSAYITFSAYPGDHPVVHTTGASGFYPYNQDYITIKGFTITADDYPGGNGIHCGTGIILGPSHHINILDNVITGNGQSGIGAVNDADYLTIKNNVIYGNTSTCYDYRGSGISLWNIGSLKDSNMDFHSVISNNYIYNNKAAWDDSHTHTDSNGIILDQIGSQSAAILVENNVIFDNGGRCIVTYDSSNSTIRNNTCYKNFTDTLISNTTPGELMDIISTKNSFYNNVVYARSSDVATVQNGYSTLGYYDYNLGFNGPILNGGSHDIAADPLFVNPSTDPATADFHLQGGSPAIDTADSSNSPATDFDNNSRPQGIGYDMGAYERLYSAATPTPVPTTTPIADSANSGNFNTTQPGVSSCQDQSPIGTPKLFQINTGPDSANLFFTSAEKPVSYYYISFGTDPSFPKYGVEFPSNQTLGVISYRIGMLKPNTKYYFRVRAGNGCATGNWSNQIYVITGKKTFTAAVKPSPFRTSLPSTVKSTPSATATNHYYTPPATNRPVMTSIPLPVPTATPGSVWQRINGTFSSGVNRLCQIFVEGILHQGSVCTR